MEKKIIKAIEQTTRELLQKMGFTPEIDVKEILSDTQSDEDEASDSGQNNIVCNISVDKDPNLLIGQFGGNLQALQHIIRLILRKKTEEKLRFIVDVNNYRQEKNQSAIEQANLAAQQALTENRAVVMNPMSSYERKIVHMELSKNRKLITESIGEGESRKVVVRPASAI